MKQVSPAIYSTDYYENECGGWEDWHIFHGRSIEPRLLYTLALAKVRPGMHILDFGCGRGEVVYQTARLGADVVGMDYSKDALRLARKLPKDTRGKMKFVHNTELKLPLKTASIDRIFYLDVLEHMYPEQLVIILKEFRRILKPRGKVILHTAPNREFMDIGYRYYTRWISKIVNPMYRLLFGEWLITRRDPRRPYDKLVHINEPSMAECTRYFTDAEFTKINLWYSSEFRDIRVRDHLRYFWLQPQLGFLKRWFCYDIWGIISPE